MNSLNNYSINIEHIAMSGQCFRWNRINENTYSIIAFGQYFEIPVDKNGILSISKPSILGDLLFNYFDLNTDYSLIKTKTEKEDIYLQSAIKEFGDIVILNQDLWEVIVSFIISQRKSIPAIKSCIEKLCKSFGNKILLENKVVYDFPKPQDIYNASLEELKLCGVGYRDKYLKSAAEWYLCDGVRNYNSVNEIYGVGNKVANCIGLFGFHDLSCCPVDVWVQKIIDKRYHGKQPKWMDSEYAGVYQQYVFMYERKLAQRR